MPLSNNISFGEFMDSALKKYDSQLLKYNAADNNCQVFIEQMLTANGLINEDIRKFVLQDAKSLVSSLPPITRKIMNGITDVVDRGQAALEGAGAK